jgi:hypothetical protein
MALIEREVGAAVAATAVALSPRARRIARQGAVYGLAGAIKAGDVVLSTARGAMRGAQQGVAAREDGGAEAAPPPEQPAAPEAAPTPRRTTRTRTPRSAPSSPATGES